MKYNELDKKLRAAGCYPLKSNRKVDHPVWFSPITGKRFVTGHHGSQEVRIGTLKASQKNPVFSSKWERGQIPLPYNLT